MEEVAIRRAIHDGEKSRLTTRKKVFQRFQSGA
jgi:hypothetical protein